MELLLVIGSSLCKLRRLHIHSYLIHNLSKLYDIDNIIDVVFMNCSQENNHIECARL